MGNPKSIKLKIIMTKEQAEFIKEAFDYQGEDCEIRSDYSGRGMYNKTTFGIVVDRDTSLLPIVIQYIKEELIGAEEDLYEAIPDFSSFRLDNMGTRYIIY